MNWIEITDYDGFDHFVNVDKIVRVREEPRFRVTDNDVAHPNGVVVRIFFENMAPIVANWSLVEFKELILRHRLGKKAP